MRNTYREILKRSFANNLRRRKKLLGLTHAEMAEQLAMDERSYTDLHHGKTCCSAVTLVLFLIYLCEDTQAFLEELRLAFEVGNHDAA